MKDNIVVAHESFHHLRLKKIGERGECGINLDMQKTYNILEWDFLVEVKIMMGLSHKWITMDQLVCDVRQVSG